MIIDVQSSLVSKVLKFVISTSVESLANKVLGRDRSVTRSVSCLVAKLLAISRPRPRNFNYSPLYMRQSEENSARTFQWHVQFQQTGSNPQCSSFYPSPIFEGVRRVVGERQRVRLQMKKKKKKNATTKARRVLARPPCLLRS